MTTTIENRVVLDFTGLRQQSPTELPKAKAENIEKLKSQQQELKYGKVDLAGNIIAEGFLTKFQLNMQQITNYVAKFK